MKRGDIVQRVVFWSKFGDSFTVYAVVLEPREDGSIYALALYEEETTVIWNKGGFVPTGRTFDLTPLEAVLRGC